MASKIHPTAVIDPDAEIGDGSEIGPFAIIEGGVRIGKGCRIAGHVQLLNTVRLGDQCRVSAGAVIGGDPQDLGFDFRTPSAVEIGSGTVIREHVTIHRSATRDGVTRLGRKNYLMATAHVGHDVQMGDHNIVANQCMLGGHVQVGNSNFLGGGGGFHQYVRVGDLCMIKGNASVSADVPPFVLVSDSNAVRGLNVVGLRRAGFDAETRKDIKAAFDHIYRGGFNLTQALEAATEREWSAQARTFIDFFQQSSRKGFCTLRRD